MSRGLVAAAATAALAGGAIGVPAAFAAEPAPTPASAPLVQVTPNPNLSLAPGAQLAPIKVLDIVTRVDDQDESKREVEENKQTKFELASDVLFGKDSATLSPRAVAKIKEVAAVIRERKVSGVIQVNGYTDNLGSGAHGLELSRERAAAVVGVLGTELKGLNVRFAPQGFGEANPVADNGTETGRKRNRRVTVIIPKSGG